MNHHLLSICLLLAAVPSRAAGVRVDSNAPNPPIPAVRVTAPPVLDGVPNDACWQDAPVATGFTRDTKPASVETEVRVLQDDEAMYFAFVCHDPQPHTIRGQQRKRNGKMGGDDTVSVAIDPRFDKQQAWWFTVNASGTQAEDIPGGSASKVEWRGDWRAATALTETGWTAEIAIPFDILRYPRGQDTFGLMFGRNVPRLLEGSNWPVRTFYYVRENEARWHGLAAPRIRRKPLVMPYVLAGSGTIESNSGVDVKYTSQNEVTSLLTVRPDFATIEDVVQTIDFSYNPRYLSDRRPFFTEGGGYYGSQYGFYSRSIGQRDGGIVPVDAGAKAFGKSGPWTFAGMGVNWGGETDSIGYLRYQPSPRFWAFGGNIGQNNAPILDSEGRSAGSLDNSVLHLGAGVWKPLAVNGISAEAQYFRTRTSGQGGEGHALQMNVDRYAGDGLFGWHLRYNEVSPDYTARLAFVPERGLRSAGGWFDQGWQVNRGGIRRWGFWTDFDYTNRWGGAMWHRNIASGVGVSFRNDMALDITLNAGDRDEFQDRTLGGEFRWHESDIYGFGVLGVRTGRVAGGPYTFGWAYQGVQLTDRVSGSVEASLLRLRGSREHFTTDRAILSGLYEFSSERSLALRLILGSEDHTVIGDPASTGTADRRSLRNAYAAYRQELRKGADIFVLAGDPNTEGIKSQVAVKYVVTY